MYPQELAMQHVRIAAWPPEVMLTQPPMDCSNGNEVRREDRVFCVRRSSEGAAGSRYETYEYATPRGIYIAHFKFTLQFPLCLNYDEPMQSACTFEQSTFEVTGLVDRMASSIRVP